LTGGKAKRPKEATMQAPEVQPPAESGQRLRKGLAVAILALAVVTAIHFQMRMGSSPVVSRDHRMPAASTQMPELPAPAAMEAEIVSADAPGGEALVPMPLAMSAGTGDSNWRGHDDLAIRSREIILHGDLVTGEPLPVGSRLLLNLFPDVELEAEVAESFVNVNGTVTTTARLAGSELGYAVLAYTDGELLSRISWPERHAWYGVNYRHDDGRHYAVELDPALAETDDVDSPHPVAPLGDGEVAIAEALADDAWGHGPLASGNVIVDVMVVYSNAALTGAGSQANMDNTIATGISQGNLAHTNTSSGITLFLIHSALVNYNDSGDLGTDLDRLTSTNDGHMDNVHTLRNTYGADFVCFMPNAPGGGIAWLLTSTGGSASYAFSVTGRASSSFASLTPAHEIGHNMGLHHAKDQNFQPGPTGGSIGTDAAGWHWHPTPGANGYCSVLTYTGGSYFPDGLSHTRVALFSDPNLTNNGLPAGHVTNGNNARVLRAMKSVYAAYRNRPGTGSVTVTINPEAARTAGAQWKLTTGANTAWQDSGTTLANVAIGTYTLAFKDIVGWTTPADQSVTVEENKTASKSGTYVIKSYTVTFQTDGTGGSSLSGSASQVVTHGGNCTAVTANAPVSHDFRNWTGSGFATSTANPLTVSNVTQDLGITANFAIKTFLVQYQSAGGGSTSRASQMVPYGSDAPGVTAIPSFGYHFVKWTKDGADHSTENPLVVPNVTSAQAYVANFALNEYTVTFLADPATGGTVNGEALITETVLHGGSSSAVTAAALPDHLFTGWVGDGGFGMVNPAQFTTITGPRTVTATFLDMRTVDHLACGSWLTVDEADLAAPIDAFTKKPKLFAVHYDLLKDPRLLKPKKAPVKVLTKVSPKAPVTAIDGEWAKRIRLYNAKAYLGERKAGTDAATWLENNPIAPLAMPLRIAAKEAGGVIVDEAVRTVLLAPPAIDPDGVAIGDEDGIRVLTVTGQWFGAKAPKAWLEYADPAGGEAIKVLNLKPRKPDGTYLDAKKKPVFMDPGAGGASTLVLPLPATPPKGIAAWTDITILVIENGVGMTTAEIPWL